MADHLAVQQEHRERPLAQILAMVVQAASEAQRTLEAAPVIAVAAVAAPLVQVVDIWRFGAGVISPSLRGLESRQMVATVATVVQADF